METDSNSNGRKIERRLLLGALISVLLLIVFYIAFVHTASGHRIDDSAYLGRHAVSRKVIILDNELLGLITKAVVLVAAAVLFLIAALRRCVFIGVVAVAGFGGAVVGAEILKDTFPWRSLIAADRLLNAGLQMGTYPSGHATIGTAFALGMLLVSSSRWRPWLAVAAGGFSSAFAAGVFFAGWHRPSDALGALAWSGVCMNLAAAFAVRLKGRPKAAIANPERALTGSVGLAILVAAASSVVAAAAAPAYPHGDLSFFALTGLIIAGSFSLTAWFGWQLRAVDFVNNRPRLG